MPPSGVALTFYSYIFDLYGSCPNSNYRYILPKRMTEPDLGTRVFVNFCFIAHGTVLR